MGLQERRSGISQSRRAPAHVACRLRRAPPSSTLAVPADVRDRPESGIVPFAQFSPVNFLKPSRFCGFLGYAAWNSYRGQAPGLALIFHFARVKGVMRFNFRVGRPIGILLLGAAMLDPPPLKWSDLIYVF